MKKIEIVQKSGGFNNSAVVVLEKQPTFVKSHYTKVERNKFKILIEQKIEETTRELKDLRSVVKNKGSEHGTDDTAFSKSDISEMSSISYDMDTKASEISIKEKFLTSLYFAQIRVDNTNFGVCIHCNGLISEQRLKLCLNTNSCVECKNKQEKINKN